jgi:hypothetical protein
MADYLYTKEKKMKDKVLFRSREYGHKGHNYCELRVLDDGDIRLWVHDGGTNSLICMDRSDIIMLGELLIKHGGTALEEHESVDILMRNRPLAPKKRKRKTRSDKGIAKVKKPLTTSMDMDIIKAQKMAAALEES